MKLYIKELIIGTILIISGTQQMQAGDTDSSADHDTVMSVSPTSELTAQDMHDLFSRHIINTNTTEVAQRNTSSATTPLPTDPQSTDPVVRIMVSPTNTLTAEDMRAILSKHIINTTEIAQRSAPSATASLSTEPKTTPTAQVPQEHELTPEEQRIIALYAIINGPQEN
jgi:hypothetical protein